MSGNAAGNASQPADFSGVWRNTLAFLQRKIWLPKLVYGAIPYFYIAAGLTALLATFYIAEWFWVLPHYVLFSFACMHIGILIFRRRRARRSANSPSNSSESP